MCFRRLCLVRMEPWELRPARRVQTCLRGTEGRALVLWAQLIAFVTSARGTALSAIEWSEESRDVGHGEVEGRFGSARKQCFGKRSLACLQDLDRLPDAGPRRSACRQTPAWSDRCDRRGQSPGSRLQGSARVIVDHRVGSGQVEPHLRDLLGPGASSRGKDCSRSGAA